MDEQTKPYLKSKNGHKCLTKCHEKGKGFLHPILLVGYNNNRTACATNPTFSKKKGHLLNLNNVVWADDCDIADNATHEVPNENESPLLFTPSITPSDFLESIYGLYSFDEVIKWSIDNAYLPFNTIRRVHNCAWLTYGITPDELTNKVINYYYDLSIKKWLPKYATSIANKYSLQISSKKDENVYDLLKNNYYDKEFFSKVLDDYIYDFEDKWDNISMHFDNIEVYIYRKLVEKIHKNVNDIYK